MWDRNLVSRLSSKAAQVLLSLLLTREIETQQTAAEFAKTTGLGQRSIAPALLELRDAGLIQIIPQPGKPSLVRLIHPEEYRYDVQITEASPEAVGPVEKPALLAGGSAGTGHPNYNSGDGKGVGAAGEEQAPDDSGGSGAGLIEQCRMADESKDGGLRVAALQDVWDFTFPFDEYPDPTQRMSNWFAQRLLTPPGQVNRSAEWLGGVILDSVQHATSRIQAPRAYIQKAVDMEEKRKGSGLTDARLGGSQESGPVISDDLRKLVELGKEQFGAKSKDSPGDIE